MQHSAETDPCPDLQLPGEASSKKKADDLSTVYSSQHYLSSKLLCSPWNRVRKGLWKARNVTLIKVFHPGRKHWKWKIYSRLVNFCFLSLAYAICASGDRTIRRTFLLPGRRSLHQLLQFECLSAYNPMGEMSIVPRRLWTDRSSK
jgi:hypothetical protein